jgi:hypothetical protein
MPWSIEIGLVKPVLGQISVAVAALQERVQLWQHRGRHESLVAQTAMKVHCILNLASERTGHVGKHVVGVAGDKMDGSDHDYQNDCHHHGVLCNVLAFVLRPKPPKKSGHRFSPLSDVSQDYYRWCPEPS